MTGPVYIDPSAPGAPVPGDVAPGPAYTDPGEPGAPVVGDVVVVVWEWHDRPGRCAGLVDRLTKAVRDGEPYAWGLEYDWVHSVRRPTPDELAAWTLGQ